MHRCHPSRELHAQSGFSLVEILVGIVIGAVALLAIVQTVIVFERHTQTTSSGGDAQVAGTLAMFNLERDIKQAGLGFGRANLATLGCNVQAEAPGTLGVFNFQLTPLRIDVGAGGAPDTIEVLYGNSSFFVTEEQFIGPPAAQTKRLARRNGFHPGDLAVVAGNASASAASATCHLIEVTADSDPDGFTIGHAPGAYASFYAAASATARYNPAAGTGTTYTGGTLYNLGPAPQLNRWTAASGVLQRVDRIGISAVPLEIADGVVSLKAQYGVDTSTPSDGTVDEWTSDPPSVWVLHTGEWNRIFAVRLAVLVRSRQFERNGDPSASATAPMTATVPVWSGSASAPFVMTDVSGAADTFSSAPTTAKPDNWRFYRYRVYERVVPLRNMLWGQRE